MESDGVKRFQQCGNGFTDKTSAFAVKDKMKLIRLRYHLAAEGCRESQVSLARSLLEEATSTVHERSENCELAVRWLVMAAEEGHVEALTLLEDCYHNGIGITVRNKEQVQACLSSGEDEKLAYHIGSSIFRMLTYDTQDEVPLIFFVCKVNTLLECGETSDVVAEETQLCESNVTVSDVVDAVLRCLRYEDPKIDLVRRPLTVCKRSGKMLQSACRICNVVVNFSRNVQEECCRLEIVLGTILVGMVVPLFPSWGLFAYHTWLFCISVTIILCVTAKILQAKLEHTNMMKWQHTIKHFKKDASFPNPKGPFVMQLFLYLLFSLILITFIGGFHPSISEIISSGSAILSFAMVLALYWHAPCSNFTKTSLLLHVLLAVMTYATLPLNFSYFPTYTVLETSLYGVDFSFNVFLLCTVFLFIFYCYLAMRFELILHILSIIWLRILVLLLNCSDFSKVCLFLLSALMVLKRYSLLLNVAIFLILNALVTQSGFVSLFLFSAFFVAKRLSKYLLNNFGAKIFFILLLPLPWLLPTGFTNDYVLEWDQYAHFCYRTNHQPGNNARTQDLCSRFKNAAISFEGTVSKVQLFSSQNVPDEILSALPLPCHLRCVLGEERQKCDSDSCLLFQRLDECPCHLDNWRSRTYGVYVAIKTTFRIIGEVEFRVENSCKDFVYGLQEGDVVLVKGLLEDRLGTDMPLMAVQSAKCLTCVENISCNFSKPNWAWKPKPFVANVLKFFFGPFIVIHA